MSILYVDELRPIDPNSTVKIDLTNNAVAFTGLSSTQNFSDFTSTNGTITTGNITTGTITNLNSTTGTITNLNSTTGTITTITSDALIVNNNMTLPVGFSPSNPGTSAKQLKDTYGYTQNGWYWIKPSSATPAIYTYCDFTTEGGGWTAYRMYGFNNSLGSRNTGYDNYSIEHRFADCFDAPLSWKRALKSGTHTEFLLYVSNSGTDFDANAADNYVVVLPTATSQDFLHKNNANGGQQGIPCYGRALGMSIGQAPYSFAFHCYWWSYTGATETHADMGHLPGAVASQDHFGYFGTINSSIWGQDKYFISMAR